MVLVADDSPTIQKRALGILKGEGYEVETVSNGVAAIKRLATIQPAVVLADVSMPGRDGYEVCDFVKKSAQLSHVPVLLVASDMEPYDDARGTQVQADGKIKKPFEPQELIAIVAKFVAQSEAEMRLESLSTLSSARAPESVPEFVVASEEQEEPPRAEQPAVTDFSADSEGMAFTEPLAEEAPAYSMEPVATETETYVSAPLPAGVSPASEPPPELAELFAGPGPDTAPAGETPVVHEPPPAAASEPVFIEERTVPIHLPPLPKPESTTMIFRAPVEIAEPVWRDEPASPPSAPEPEGVATLEAPLESETPTAPIELPVEQPAEPSQGTPAVAAMSLDSFSLDDAAAGQVHFALDDWTEFLPASAAAPATEVAPEEAPAEVQAEIPTETPSEAPAEVQAEISTATPSEAPAEVQAEIPTETPSEAPAEVQAEIPTETLSEAPAEVQPEISTETLGEAPAEVQAEISTATLGEAPAEVQAEIPTETPSEAPAEVQAEISTATLGEAPAEVQAEIPTETPSEAPTEVQTEIPTETPLETPVETQAKAGAGTYTSPPAFDWEMLYSVVRKVVLKMSPPALGNEIIEELAREIADEIASELSDELPPPKT
jgi:CheY-like chemotaxis protein